LIQVRAYLNSQHIISDVVQVQLGYGNLAIQADPNLSSSGQLFPQNVEMILDGSIRMNESMNAWVKWDLVRGGLKKIKEFVPEGTQIGLRLFGTESMVQQDNCGDSKKLKTIFGKLNELKAQGKSPLAFALKRLFEDGKKVKISKVGILLLSDWDNCGLDPLDYLRKSSKESSNVRLHVIYFGDVSPTKETLIKNIAAKMGGKAFKVFNMNDLEAALKETLQVQAVLLDYKNATILQTPLDVKTHRVRSGEYHLLVDSYPPPRLKKIIIPTEGTKTIFLKQIEGGYELEEK
jgi:hypothetical protein